MGDNVELDIGFIDAVAFFILSANVGLLFGDKALQARCIFSIAAAPIVVELETGEMIAAVIDPVQSQAFVAIATNAKGGQNAHVGADIDGDA